MRHIFDPERLQAAANRDGEFRLQSRHWDAHIEIADLSTNDRVDYQVSNGAMTKVSPGANVDVRIAASTEHWREMLKRVPPPFFHDLWSARVHHGVRYEGEMEHIAAYYPATRRLLELIRSVATR